MLFYLQKNFASKKFDESIDLSIVLGVDAKKSDQQIRGVLSIPKMPEKKVVFAIFAEGKDQELAKKSGADVVGSDDLIEKIKKGEINFDKCVSTPQMMVKVSALGQILGPKGLMPNPKLGTVTNDLPEAIKKSNRVRLNIKLIKPELFMQVLEKLVFQTMN